MIESNKSMFIVVLVVVVMYLVYDMKYKKNTDGFTTTSVREVTELDTGDSPMSDYGSGVQESKIKKQYNAVADNLEAYDGYNAVVQYAALEPEIFESQKEYTENLGMTSGASALSTRSDPNDVVTWVGLRRPDYHSVYAGSDARVVHSEYPDQLYKGGSTNLF